jgi:Jacalin-like lectin domain
MRPPNHGTAVNPRIAIPCIKAPTFERLNPHSNPVELFQMFARLLLFMFTLFLAPSWARADEARTKVGPAGGEGGDEFADNELPKGARVVGVKIRHGLFIDGIALLYKTADDKQESLGWHGGDGGDEETFLLEAGEHITGISGKTGEYVESLTIVTNKRKSKTYGGEGGEGGDKAFSLQKSGEEVTGFYGRSGAFLDQIGIFVRKKP